MMQQLGIVMVITLMVKHLIRHKNLSGVDHGVQPDLF